MNWLEFEARLAKGHIPSNTEMAAYSQAKRQRTDICVAALVKGQERYIVMYSEDNRCEALRQLGSWASNPELSFSWTNAAQISQKIRQEAKA